MPMSAPASALMSSARPTEISRAKPTNSMMRVPSLRTLSIRGFYCGNSSAGKERTLRRKAIPDDLEEGADPRRLPQVGMGDDPEFAGEGLGRCLQRPDEAGF